MCQVTRLSFIHEILFSITTHEKIKKNKKKIAVQCSLYKISVEYMLTCKPTKHKTIMATYELGSEVV